MISGQLRLAGFEPDDGIRQTLGLAEEAGEFVGAYRRWTNRARRRGTEQEAQAEFADVVITSHVTAAELGHKLDVPWVSVMYRVEPADAWIHVLDVFSNVNHFVTERADGVAGAWALELVVQSAYHAAAVLGWDAPALIEAKLEKIFTRGWREPVLEGETHG
jgi:hypothetical protein